MYIQYKLVLRKLTGTQSEIIEIIDDQPKILTSKDPIIKSIKLQFQNNQEISAGLFVTFNFHSEDMTLEIAERNTESLLNSIINLLIYKLNVSISEPKIHAYAVVDKSVVASGSITLYNPEHYELPELDYSWLADNIDSSTLSQELKSSSHFQMYKSILLVENVISRFLLLYSLLYELKQNQYKTDTYIQEKEPEVRMIESTKRHRKDKEEPNLETEYTWWRNQSQHMQDDTSINEITKNYSKLIDGLQQIVFQAIIESLKLSPN